MRRQAQRLRGSARTGAGFVLGLAILSVAACADVFGLNDAGRRVDAGGAGGRGGSAGQRPGASGNGARAGGTAAGMGGSAGSKGEPGGEGGSRAATGGSSHGGGGSVGTSGAAGDDTAAEPGVRRLGRACTTGEDGDLACSDASPYLILECQDGAWAEKTTCELNQRCDPRDPRCTPFDSVCASFDARGPVCDGNDVFDCNPEHYAVEHRVCPFGCRAGACEPGSVTQLTLHTGVTPPTLNAWSDNVPVCFATKSTGDEADWVRDEVERVYNRFLSFAFVGWESCDEDPTGVVLSFEDDCRGFLVNDVAPGKPQGDDPLALTLCRSYRDNAEVDHPVDENESLLRLLARHQFAHVLGLLDGTDARVTSVVRGVERGSENDLALTWDDYVSLDSVLGKGVNRISTPNGTCLSSSSSKLGATVGADLCEPEPDRQLWKPVTDRIRNNDSSACFESSGMTGGDITLQACKLTGDDQKIRLAHAQWRTPTRCVAPEHMPPVEGTLLVTEPCDDAGQASQAWFFEILGDGDPGFYWAQIHFGESGLCIAPPSDGTWWDPVALVACATAPLIPPVGTTAPKDPHVLLIGPNGIRSFGVGSINCVNWQGSGGLLVLSNCGTVFSHFFLSGALEVANGLALSLAGPSGTLVATTLGALPTPDQIFDVYF